MGWSQWTLRDTGQLASPAGRWHGLQPRRIPCTTACTKGKFHPEHWCSTLTENTNNKMFLFFFFFCLTFCTNGTKPYSTRIIKVLNTNTNDSIRCKERGVSTQSVIWRNTEEGSTDYPHYNPSWNYHQHAGSFFPCSPWNRPWQDCRDHIWKSSSICSRSSLTSNLEMCCDELIIKQQYDTKVDGKKNKWKKCFINIRHVFSPQLDNVFYGTVFLTRV